MGFINELNDAIAEYGEESVDIIVNREQNYMCGYYHSQNDSFPVTENYTLQPDYVSIANNLNIGHAEL